MSTPCFHCGVNAWTSCRHREALLDGPPPPPKRKQIQGGEDRSYWVHPDTLKRWNQTIKAKGGLKIQEGV